MECQRIVACSGVCLDRASTPPLLGGVGKRWSGSVSGRVHGALLGPEATGPRPSAHVPHGCAGCVLGGSVVCLGCPRAWPRPAGSGIPFLRGCWWWGVGVLGLLFGNCIVDASILYRGTPFVVFSRANSNFFDLRTPVAWPFAGPVVRVVLSICR